MPWNRNRRYTLGGITGNVLFTPDQRGDDIAQRLVVAAENVPGVKAVRDHLAWVDATSGIGRVGQRDKCRRFRVDDQGERTHSCDTCGADENELYRAAAPTSFETEDIGDDIRLLIGGEHDVGHRAMRCIERGG